MLVKKLKKQSSIESNAIQSLKLISQGETGYLQDWAKTNEIKEEDIQTSTQIQPNVEQYAKENQIKIRVVKNGGPQFQNRRTLREIKLRKNKKKASEEQEDVKPINYSTLSHRRIEFVVRQGEQQLMTQRKQRYKNQNIQTATLYHKAKSFSSFSYEQQQKCRTTRYEKCKKIRSSSSTKYLQRLRKVSLIGLKTIKKQKQADVQNHKIQQQQDQKRLAQLIRNKLKRKHSNGQSYQPMRQSKKIAEINEKIIISEPYTEMCTINHENEEERKQVQILKAWLDSNRFKSKKTVTSLLREHFQNKYIKKKHSQTDAANRCSKLFLIISKQVQNFQ